MKAHDFAVVFLDDKLVGSFKRSAQNHRLNVTCSGECKLYVLVQAMGHVNFDHSMEKDKKGLMEFS